MKKTVMFNLILALLIGSSVTMAFGDPVAGTVTTSVWMAGYLVMPKLNIIDLAFTGAAEVEIDQEELLKKVKSEATNAVTDKLKEFKSLTKDEVEDIISESLKNHKDLKPEEIKAIKDDLSEIKNLTEAFNSFNKTRETGEAKNYKDVVKGMFAAENLKDEIRKVYNEGTGKIDVAKVVGPVTTASATTTSGGNAIMDMLNADDIREIGLRDTWIEQYATVSRSSKPVYSYTEWIPGEGEAAFVAENAAKPQIDHDVVTRVLTPDKVAGYEILSDEAIDDIPRMESQARAYILKKVMLKRQNGILFGDGVGANPLGVTAIASTVDVGSWAADIPAAEFNEYAAIVAVLNKINLAQNYADDIDYAANLIIMNPKDIAFMKLRRDGANGGYLFPTMGLLGNNTVEGIPVIANKSIPAGSIFAGDFTKLNIVNYIDFAISMGWVNDQFIKNQFTMLGESRFYTYVKNLDQKAFVYDTFAAIKVAITDAI